MQMHYMIGLLCLIIQKYLMRAIMTAIEHNYCVIG